MKIDIKILSLVLLFFAVMACSEEKVPQDLPEGPTSISALIDGEQWETVDYEATLNVIPERGQFFELSAAGSSYQMNLSLLEFDKSTGTISKGTFEEAENIIFNLFKADEEGNSPIEYKPMQAEENEESPVSITITASTNSRISGTFSGIVYKVALEDQDEYPVFLIITNGIFNNLPFETKTVNIR